MSFDQTFSAPPPPAAPVEPMSWPDLWALAITSPTPQAYEEILANPRAQNNPMLWVGFSSALAMIFSTVVGLMFGGFQIPAYMTAGMTPAEIEEFRSFMASSTAAGVICYVPIAIVGAILGFMVSIFFLNLWCKLVGGQGTYGNLLFSVAAFHVPLTVIMGAIGSVPLLNFVSIPILIYMQYLTLCAVKATHRFGWGKTILAAWVIPLIIFIVLCVILYAVLMAVFMPYFMEIIKNNPGIY